MTDVIVVGGGNAGFCAARTRPLLRPHEYDSEPISMAQADTLNELARALDSDPAGLERTVTEFHAALNDNPFDPAVKDGRAAARA